MAKSALTRHPRVAVALLGAEARVALRTRKRLGELPALVERDGREDHVHEDLPKGSPEPAALMPRHDRPEDQHDDAQSARDDVEFLLTFREAFIDQAGGSAREQQRNSIAPERKHL